ncbi:unnamed protein product [Prorocentrum cordatum]|uniref:Uncharacterized protein n=1 Tax=Prorocentrum cordatum TaxID=2364126 RepID=A0ABN9QS44_9DINO|nr:unnamed protein product [Polarella glacialis]
MSQTRSKKDVQDLAATLGKVSFAAGSSSGTGIRGKRQLGRGRSDPEAPHRKIQALEDPEPEFQDCGDAAGGDQDAVQPKDTVLVPLFTPPREVRTNILEHELHAATDLRIAPAIATWLSDGNLEPGDWQVDGEAVSKRFCIQLRGQRSYASKRAGQALGALRPQVEISLGPDKNPKMISRELGCKRIASMLVEPCPSRKLYVDREKGIISTDARNRLERFGDCAPATACASPGRSSCCRVNRCPCSRGVPRGASSWRLALCAVRAAISRTCGGRSCARCPAAVQSGERRATAVVLLLPATPVDDEVFVQTWIPSNLDQFADGAYIEREIKRRDRGEEVLYERLLAAPSRCSAEAPEAVRTQRRQQLEVAEDAGGGDAEEASSSDEDGEEAESTRKKGDGHKPEGMSKAEWKALVKAERADARKDTMKSRDHGMQATLSYRALIALCSSGMGAPKGTEGANSYYCNGGWEGKGYGGTSSNCGGGGGGMGGFGNVLGQWSGMVDSIRAFGEIGCISSVIRQADQATVAGISPPTAGAHQAVQGVATNSQPARDLALAHTSVMSGAQGSDSKLQHAIKRLAEAAGLAANSTSDLEDNPVIERMRSELAATQPEITGRSDQLQTIQTSTATTSNGVRAVRSMLEGMFSGGSDHGTGPHQSQPGHSARPLQAVHAASALVFLASVNLAQHELALSYLGISRNREDVKSYATQCQTQGAFFLLCMAGGDWREEECRPVDSQVQKPGC